MDGRIASGLFSGVLSLIGLALLLGAGIVGISWYLSSEDIISRKSIIPEIQLTTDGKTVDTLYIYHKP